VHNAIIAAVVTVALLGAIFAIVRLRSPAKVGLGESFTYDVAALRKTDPRLIMYHEVEKLSTGFETAVAIAIGSDDRTYVAGDKSIRAFDSSGRRTLEIALPDAPTGLAISDEGDIFAGLRDHIEVYNSEGVLRDRWQSLGPQSRLTSIAILDDHVFIADAGLRQVTHYDVSGAPISIIGQKDEAQGVAGFVVPHPYFDLAVADDGLLRVANPGRHRIEFYTFDGSLELWWGEVSMQIEGFAGCGNPANFALFPDGRLVTCEKGLPRVKIYSPQGVFAGVVAGAEQFPDYLFDGVSGSRSGELDVAVDSHGRVLVLDATQKAVRIFVANDIN
ncbi:MAG: hypothetical protein QGG64_25930, partial [Candidatus Latescibacteria bacterium]|nr:hypothetical protein [Candidatus Latescibacterota bacterium]